MLDKFTKENNFWEYLSSLLEIGMLTNALKLNLFELLADRNFKKIEEIKEELKFKCTIRTLADFLDKLTVHNYLERENLLENASYKITETSQKYFTLSSKDNIVFSMTRLASHFERISYVPQILKEGTAPDKDNFFINTYQSPEIKSEFIKSCLAGQFKKFELIVKNFQFPNFGTFLDIGGGPAAFSVLIKRHFKVVKCFSFDLPEMEKDALSYLKENQMEDKIILISGDVFNFEFPKADIISMGNILHEYNHENKQKLFKIAYNTLNPKGAFLIIEDFIDNNRIENSNGLNMSLLMLLYYGDSFNLSLKDIEAYALEAGFVRVENLRYKIGTDLVVCYKN